MPADPTSWSPTTSALRAAAGHLAATPSAGAHPFAGVATGQALPFGVPDDDVDVRIDASAHLAAKVAAMRAHRSQMHPEGWFFAPATRPGTQMGIECYTLLHHRGYPGDPESATPPTGDLLDGL